MSKDKTMIFKLETVAHLYIDKKRTYISFLKELGFEFESVESEPFSIKEDHVNIELNTLEELLELQRNCEHSLIVTNDTIRIYDGYNE